MTAELKKEILRFAKLTGSTTTRDVIEGMRNRWQKKLGLDNKDFANYIHLMITQAVEESQTKTRGWISFAWTTDALVNGHKSVTRREWKDSYVSTFRQGDLVKAYDKRPDFGGKPVALIRLTQTPYQQMSDKVKAVDWIHEGFDYLEKNDKKSGKKTPREIWQDWKDNPRKLWVVRFEVVELL